MLRYFEGEILYFTVDFVIFEDKIFILKQINDSDVLFLQIKLIISKF
jgi:hypothetical protein